MQGILSLQFSIVFVQMVLRKSESTRAFIAAFNAPHVFVRFGAELFRNIHSSYLSASTFDLCSGATTVYVCERMALLALVLQT